jgi:hypothetical protein
VVVTSFILRAWQKSLSTETVLVYFAFQGIFFTIGTEKLEEEMQMDRPSMNFNSNPIKVDSQFQFSMRGKELL